MIELIDHLVEANIDADKSFLTDSNMRTAVTIKHTILNALKQLADKKKDKKEQNAKKNKKDEGDILGLGLDDVDMKAAADAVDGEAVVMMDFVTYTCVSFSLSIF